MAIKAVHTAAKFSITALIGVFMFLNVLPWINVSQQLAANVPTLVNSFNFLYSIPILGWFLKGLIENLAVVVGAILWATVQAIEILPTLIERPQSLYPLITAWDGVELKEKGKKNHERMDALKRRFNESLVRIIDNLKLYRAIAYVFEALVCLWTYPPYTGGWQQLVKDYPVLDWDYVSFPNMISAVVTMFAFEWLFMIALNLWGLTDIIHFGSRYKSEPDKTPATP